MTVPFDLSKRRLKNQFGGRTVFNLITQFDLKYKETTSALSLRRQEQHAQSYYFIIIIIIIILLLLLLLLLLLRLLLLLLLLLIIIIIIIILLFSLMIVPFVLSKRRLKNQYGGRTVFNLIAQFDLKYKETTSALSLTSVQNRQKINCDNLLDCLRTYGK